jgi:probable phosphoglycerate mutase
MSSLQCPARVLVAQHGEASYAGDLAERLRGERIARVWTSSLVSAVATAEIAAARLGVGVELRERVDEEVLDEIADEHPGEAVLVVGDGEALLATVSRLVGVAPAPGPGVVELEKDADGWRLADGPD